MSAHLNDRVGAPLHQKEKKPAAHPDKRIASATAELLTLSLSIVLRFHHHHDHRQT